MQTNIQRDPLNPYPWFRLMRDTQPVAYNNEMQCWEIFRYDDVLYTLNTPEMFSSDIFSSFADKTPLDKSVIFLDPPRHKLIRSLVAQTFSPKRLANFAPQISKIVNNLLNEVSAFGKMDVITDFANQVPMIVISELLGVSPEDRTDFLRWSDTTISNSQTGRLTTVPEMNTYFYTVINEHRKNPKDDVISTLIQSHVEGQALTDDEILGFCELLLVAGYETTVHLLGNLFWFLDEFPETQIEIWRNSDVIPNMIEETLRYRAPISIQTRIAVNNTELQGQQILKGQVVMPSLASGNRDERHFSDPDNFNLYRFKNKTPDHLSFGFRGIHFCLGAPLARLEAKVVLECCRNRLVNIQRDRSIILEPISLYGGLKHLPISFKMQ